MKKLLPTLALAFGLTAVAPLVSSEVPHLDAIVEVADASLGGGKSTDTQPNVAPATAAEVEAAPPALSEEVAAGSDADQAVENLGSPVDPTGDPAGYFDTLVTWYKAGWLLPFVFLIALGIVTYAARYITWLGATPKRALIVAAVTAFVADVVTRASTGSPLTLPILIAALGVGLNTYFNGGKAVQRSADGVAAKFGPA